MQLVDLLHCCTARRSPMRAPLKAFDVVWGSPRVRRREVDSLPMHCVATPPSSLRNRPTWISVATPENLHWRFSKPPAVPIVLLNQELRHVVHQMLWLQRTF